MFPEADSCLFVTRKGTLILVFCVFQVIVLEDVNTLKQGDIVDVSAVKVTQEGVLVFEVGEHFYYFYHFDLIL